MTNSEFRDFAGELMPLALAEYVRALESAGQMFDVLNPEWYVIHRSAEMKRLFNKLPLSSNETNKSWFGPEFYGLLISDPEFELNLSINVQRARRDLSYAIYDFHGDKELLRPMVDDALLDLFNEAEPLQPPAAWTDTTRMSMYGSVVTVAWVHERIFDDEGNFVGLIRLWHPSSGMADVFSALATADQRHLDRLASIEQASRRPGAILIADLEASSPLSKALPTTKFFAFGRRLTRMVDQCIIEAGGIVGRHAGDGITAFFLVDQCGSESEAVRSCIEAARAIRGSLDQVVTRSDLPAETYVRFRFALHFGSTIYVGRISTGGRSEVTALGDQVNETARMEACATGGRTLASKELIERLDVAAANSLGIDLNNLAFTELGKLVTATEKARRDAPSVAVCDV